MILTTSPKCMNNHNPNGTINAKLIQVLTLFIELVHQKLKLFLFTNILLFRFSIPQGWIKKASHEMNLGSRHVTSTRT